MPFDARSLSQEIRNSRVLVQTVTDLWAFPSFLLFSSSDLAGEGAGRGRRKWCSGEARWTGGVRHGAAGQRLVRHGGAEGQVIMQ